MKDKLSEVIEKYPIIQGSLPVIKAIISVFPIGGVITSLFDYLPNVKIKRLEKTLKAFEEDYQKYKIEGSIEYIKTEEFGYLFEKALKASLETYQEEKRRGFRAILVNSFKTPHQQEEEKDIFLNILINLTELHIRIMKILYNIEQCKAQYIQSKGEPFNGNFRSFIRHFIPEINEEILMGIIGDLDSKGLFDSKMWDGVPALMEMSGIDYIPDKITKLGKRFIEFITLKDE